MGVFVSVRGWIDACNESLPLIRALIERDEDELGGYTESWCFQKVGGGGGSFVFFGGVIRAAAVERVQRQVRRIAETVITHDGQYVDYPQGDFLLEHESHEGEPDQYPLTRWRFARGIFYETSEKGVPDGAAKSPDL